MITLAEVSDMIVNLEHMLDSIVTNDAENDALSMIGELSCLASDLSCVAEDLLFSHCKEYDHWNMDAPEDPALEPA